MRSSGKRILAALWVAGAVAGLLAVVFLPGRLDFGAQAHLSTGVQIVDTEAFCDDHELNAGAGPTAPQATRTPTPTRSRATSSTSTRVATARMTPFWLTPRRQSRW